MERSQITRTSCAIAGGGPAGLMLALLLVRAGVEVVVLEKHADFLRDFRGDTVHPSTLQVMHELGLLERFLALPHQEVRELSAFVGDTRFALADFTHLPLAAPMLVMMPQWDFLDFLADEAGRFDGFRLVRRAEVTGLVEEDGVVRGVRARTPDGELVVLADLVVGADGRGSVLRDQSGLVVDDLGAPIDVLWFRISRRPVDADETQGRIDPGSFTVWINRGEYWQCAYVIKKDGLPAIRAQGIARFRELINDVAPFDDSRTSEIASWDDVRLLRVQVNRLREWARPGLIFIGDAAHAMSPVGGVGINLAIQDAVAAANRLAVPLRERRLSMADLRAVQARRALPTRLTQAAQVFAQDRVIAPTLGADEGVRPPVPLRLLDRSSRLRRLPARLIGMGVRPEHVAPHLRQAVAPRRVDGVTDE